MTYRRITVKLSAVRPTLLVFALIAGCSSTCFAGRPLSVDDANTADAGTGNIDFWFTRAPGNVNGWTVSPAYGIADGIELGATWATDTTNNTSASTLQLKFRLTAAKDQGCNFGTSIGVTQASDVSGNTPFMSALVTCNLQSGSVNLNLGLSRSPDSPTLKTWGLSFERELGTFTPHIEIFGVEQSAPTVQLGLRTMVTNSLQLDGSIGSTRGETTYTLGMRFFF